MNAGKHPISRASGVALLTLAALALGATSAGRPQTSATPSRFMLRVDEGAAFRLESVEALDTTTSTGTTTDATLAFVPFAGSEALAWIGPALAGTSNPPRRLDLFSGASDGALMSRRLFPHVAILSLSLPELDAAAARKPLTWRVALERTASSTSAPGGTLPTEMARPKAALPDLTAFKLELANLDCSRVAKIGALKVTPPRTGEKVVARVERPTTPPVTNLTLSMASANAAPFTQWLAAGAAPKNGRIVHMTSSLTHACTTTLTNVVIRKVTTTSPEAGDQSPRATVEATVGSLGFSCP